MILIQQHSLGSSDSTQQLRVALKAHKNGNINTPYNTSKKKKKYYIILYSNERYFSVKKYYDDR